MLAVALVAQQIAAANKAAAIHFAARCVETEARTAAGSGSTAPWLSAIAGFMAIIIVVAARCQAILLSSLLGAKLSRLSLL